MSAFTLSRRTLLAGAATSIVAGATTAWAYPDQMIKIVVTFPPGGKIGRAHV